MKKFLFFLRTISPAILAVCPNDDGSLFINYTHRGQVKSTVMTLSDYELATAKGNNINGLHDHLIGLS